MWWTLASATIASATALFISVKIYPLQKQKDRELKLGEERRAAYRRYVTAVMARVDELITSQKLIDQGSLLEFKEKLGDSHASLAVEIALLALIADDKILVQANEINGHFEKSLLRTADFLKGRDQVPKVEVHEALKQMVREAARSTKDGLLKMITDMRLEEFRLENEKAPRETTHK